MPKSSSVILPSGISQETLLLWHEISKIFPDRSKIIQKMQEGADLERHISAPRHPLVSGKTPIIWASYWGDKKVVQYLLDQHVRLDSRDEFGQNALMWAAKNNHFEVVDLFVKAGASLEESTLRGHTALLISCQNNLEEMAFHLLKHGASVSARSDTGETPLMAACLNNMTKLVRTLIDMGANVSDRDNNGADALWHTRTQNPPGENEKVATILIENGADPLSVDKYGKNALFYAIAHRQKKRVEFLTNPATFESYPDPDIHENLIQKTFENLIRKYDEPEFRKKATDAGIHSDRIQVNIEIDGTMKIFLEPKTSTTTNAPIIAPPINISAAVSSPVVIPGVPNAISNKEKRILSSLSLAVEHLQHLVNIGEEFPGVTYQKGGTRKNLNVKISTASVVTHQKADLALWKAYFTEPYQTQLQNRRWGATRGEMKRDAFWSACTQASGATPSKDWAEKLDWLFEIGGRPHLEHGWTNLIHILASASCADRVSRQLSIEKIANLAEPACPNPYFRNGRIPESPWMLCTSEGSTAFLLAVRAGEPEMAQWLFEKDPMAAIGDKDGSVAEALTEHCDIHRAASLVACLRTQAPHLFVPLALAGAQAKATHNEACGDEWRKLCVTWGKQRPEPDAGLARVIIPGRGITIEDLKHRRKQRGLNVADNHESIRDAKNHFKMK